MVSDHCLASLTDVLEKSDHGFSFLPEARNSEVKIRSVSVCVYAPLKEPCTTCINLP